MLTVEQKKMRKTGIGGSDIAAIAGVNPWKSALDVYLDKLNLVEDVEENLRMERGSYLEPFIAGKYIDNNPGVSLINPKQTFRHPKRSWMLSTPDRFVKKNGDTWGLEIKDVGIRVVKLWGEPGTDEAPDYVLTQAQWYIEGGSLDRWDIAALLGDRYAGYTVQRNQKLIDRLVEIGEKFWIENVQAKNPPAAGASESAKKALALLYPSHVEEFLESTAEIEGLVAELKAAKLELWKGDTVVVGLENRIKELLGQKQGVMTEAGKVTWKKSKDTMGINWEQLAREHMDPTTVEKLIKKFAQVVKKGSRRFNTPRGWKE